MLPTLPSLVTALSVAVGNLIDLPDHETLANYQPPLTTRIFASDGRLVEEYFTQNRMFVPIEAIPPVVIQAFVSAEDKSFWEHEGVDWSGVARAALVNVEHMVMGGRLQGGSTITQQVAKNLLLTNERSLRRKLRELVLAMLIERDFSKDKILELYLNEIYLGRGTYGIAAASSRYFGKSPSELTLAEAAYLAALPKAPNNYHPVFRHDAAVERRDWVIDRMFDDGAITMAQAAEAKAQPLGTIDESVSHTVEAAYFAEEVRRGLQREYGADALYRGGLQVETTLHADLQEIADRALRNGLVQYDRRHGWRGPVANIEMVVTLQASLDALDEEAPAEAPAPPLSTLAEVEADIEMGLIEAAAPPPAASGGLFGRLSSLAADLPGSIASRLPSARPAPEPEPAPAAAAEEPPAPDLPLWQAALLDIKAPPGAGDWPLAVVLDVDSRRAIIGMADGEVGELPLDEVEWARTRRAHQVLGPEIRRVTDVLALGDVVLVEALESAPAGDEGRRIYGLRQVPDVEGSVIAMEPQTGQVLAMSGGLSYSLSEFNRATQALRQPGSAFKPFVYLAALEQGMTPSTVLLDAPVAINLGPGLGTWRPENYTRSFAGAVPLREGLERSRNLLTVQILKEIGMGPIKQVAETFGLYDDMPMLPSMVLGAGETSLLRLTNAYAMLANGGKRVHPFLIQRIQDRTGRTIYRHDQRACDGCGAGEWTGQETPELPDQREQIADPISVYQLVSMMEGVIQRGTASRLNSLGLTLAGKTGTTNESQDTWFVGFSPDLVVGVFVGFDDPKTLGNETGSSAPTPIFGEIMQSALAGMDVRPFPQPSGLSVARVDANTGYLAGPESVNVTWEYFRPGTEPTEAPYTAPYTATYRPTVGAGGAVGVTPVSNTALSGTGGLY